MLHYPDIRHANWKLLHEAARKQAIRLDSWQPHRLQIRCMDEGAWAYYDGKPVHPRIILHRTVAAFQGIVVPALKLWSSEGFTVLNEPDAAYRSRDKLLTSIALQRARVPIVHTISFIEPSTKSMELFGDHEIILKPAHGTRGEGILVFRSTDDLLTTWVNDNREQPTILPLTKEHYVAQPLVKGGGRDLRAFVVDDACIALMQRQAAPGEVRANLALGATCTRISLNHPAARTAVAALAACQLDYGGVDLIEDEDGTIRVIEVDAWAGFAGISAVTQEDVAGAILRLALTRQREDIST